MVDDLTVDGIASQFPAHDGTSVRAAVDHGVDLAVLAAVDDDRRVPDIRGDEIAGVRNLGLEGYIRPYRSAKHALLLGFVDFLVVVQPERHTRVVVAGPGDFKRRWTLGPVF